MLTFTFTDPVTDRPWHVKIIERGMTYGREECLTHQRLDPLVEFWDVHRGMDKKQFVSRYYLSTLMARSDDIGLNLDGGVPEWHVSAKDMGIVYAFLEKDHE